MKIHFSKRNKYTHNVKIYVLNSRVFSKAQALIVTVYFVYKGHSPLKKQKLRRRGEVYTEIVKFCCKIESQQLK